ncbi:MAG TPA: hypothetical protein VEV41_10650 [Terriglobales bacterium]|nr:hypothetical protein [Terriglobales bacterium]
MDKEMQEKLRTLFERHWNAFQQEATALYATPETQRQIQEAIEAVLEEQDFKGSGLALVLAQHMEAILPRLLAGADSPEKKDRLLEAFSRHLRAQVMEFTQILQPDVLKR